MTFTNSTFASEVFEPFESVIILLSGVVLSIVTCGAAPETTSQNSLLSVFPTVSITATENLYFPISVGRV